MHVSHRWDRGVAGARRGVSRGCPVRDLGAAGEGPGNTGLACALEKISSGDTVGRMKSRKQSVGAGSAPPFAVGKGAGDAVVVPPIEQVVVDPRDVSGAAGDAVRDARAEEVRARSEWEAGFAAWDPTVGRDVGARAVMAAAGVTEGRARVLIRVGDERYGLVSYEARMREAVRELVAKDKRGESLEVVERRGVEGIVKDREKALKLARAKEAEVLGDAVSQHADEVKTIRRVRMAANVLLTVETNLLKSVVELSKSLGADLAAGTLKMKPREKVALIRDVAAIVKSTAETTRLAVMTERVILGKPLDMLGGKGSGAIEHMSPEEAGQYVELAIRARERAKRKGAVLEVVGSAVPPVGHVEGVDEDAEISELEALLDAETGT